MIDDPLNRVKVKRGSDLSWSKLTEDDVLMIRALFAEREYLRKKASELTNEKIAEKFGVHRCTIEKVASGETWGYVG